MAGSDSIQRVQRRCRSLREKYPGVLHGNSRKFPKKLPKIPEGKSSRIRQDFQQNCRQFPKIFCGFSGSDIFSSICRKVRGGPLKFGTWTNQRMLCKSRKQLFFVGKAAHLEEDIIKMFPEQDHQGNSLDRFRKTRNVRLAPTFHSHPFKIPQELELTLLQI